MIRAISQTTVILLSFFDGIATAAFVLDELKVKVPLFMAWETDKDCHNVAATHFPSIWARGDIEQDDMSDIYQEILKIDPKHEAMVMFTGGAPCHDYTNMKQRPQGRSGKTGRLFDLMVDKVDKLKQQVQKTHKVVWVYENVVPNPSLGQVDHHFDRRTNSTSFVMDAADDKIIGRARMWWTSVDWKTIDQQLQQAINVKLHWTQIGQRWQLRNFTAQLLQQPLTLKGIKLPDEVTRGQRLMPCLTTPEEKGRTPPDHTQVSKDTWKRWEEGGKQYAPWHYAKSAMISVNDKLTLPTPELKEEMHQLPRGYTDHGATPTKRSVMLGNGWHVGCARAVFFMTLLSAQVDKAQSISRSLNPFGYSKMEIMANRWIMARVPWGPAEPVTKRLIPETSDLQWHFTEAMKIEPPTMRQVEVDPMIKWTYQQLQEFGPAILTWREDIRQELQDILDDHSEQTWQWWGQRPSHVQKAYMNPQTKRVTQIPIVLDIMRKINVPNMDKWEQRLNQGFNMLGHLDPGPGWKNRTDGKLSEPWSIQEMAVHNRQYIQDKASQHKVDERWEKMLTEIIADKDLLRMEGPFEAPSWANFQTADLPASYLLPKHPLDDHEIIIAWAFAICQIGSDGMEKIRRGEDYRRGGQNGTTHAFDQPHHHTPDHFVASANQAHEIWPEEELQLWGHDHDGAYRQLPVDNPAVAFALLMTPWGPTLWTHNVLMFGAVASVWAYNSFADVLVAMARILMLIPVLHYVDDYGAVDIAPLAESSFNSFKDLNDSLGFLMKKSKEQPPATKHKMQGVFIEFKGNQAIISACKRRVRRLLQWIQQIKAKQCLPPEEAKTFAGKAGFVASSLFGRVGRCAMRAIWTRAASNDHGPAADKMSPGIEDSLENLTSILLNAPPRSMTMNYSGRRAIIYTDAYFKLGEQMVKIGKAFDLTDWLVSQVTENGWGFVVIPDQQHPEIGFTLFGTVPTEIIQLFSGTKAFIYFLEALAAIIAPMMLRTVLPEHYVSFVDNEAAKFALLKGYGKQKRVNQLIATFWNFNAANRLSPWIERVSSGANWADSVSRNDFSLSEQKGWIRMRPRLNYIWPILKRIATESTFAHSSGHQELSRALQESVQGQLTARGFLKPN